MTIREKQRMMYLAIQGSLLHWVEDLDKDSVHLASMPINEYITTKATIPIERLLCSLYIAEKKAFKERVHVSVFNAEGFGGLIESIARDEYEFLVDTRLSPFDELFRVTREL